MKVATGTTTKHPLRVWAFLNDLCLRDVAKSLGVSPTLISLWMSGQRRISSAQSSQIEEMTGGDVTIADWPWVWLPDEGREIKAPGAGREPEPVPDPVRRVVL